MSDTVIVPVLQLDDEVVLPQMVVPLDLADADLVRFEDDGLTCFHGFPGCGTVRRTTAV